MKRWGWFFLLYLAGLAAVAGASYVLRAAISAMV
jgi:hypothetical protein